MRHPILFLLLMLLVSGCDPTASAEQGNNHRIQPGETLFAIAERAYGNGLLWPLIWEANPWIDPDRLPVGKEVYVPRRNESWADPPPHPDHWLQDSIPERHVGGMVSKNPSSAKGGTQIFRNLKKTVSQKTLFGYTLDRAFLVALVAFALHAFLQSALVWLAANITFVREVSLKKAVKAVILTETLTFTTLMVVMAVAILVVHLGVDPSTGADGGRLFPTVEGYLSSPTGILLAGFVLLALYVTLSLRFLPQVFNVPLSHAITLMTIAILIPHLVGAYLIGQRTGLIH